MFGFLLVPWFKARIGGTRRKRRRKKRHERLVFVKVENLTATEQAAQMSRTTRSMSKNWGSRLMAFLSTRKRADSDFSHLGCLQNKWTASLWALLYNPKNQCDTEAREPCQKEFQSKLAHIKKASPKRGSGCRKKAPKSSDEAPLGSLKVWSIV